MGWCLWLLDWLLDTDKCFFVCFLIEVYVFQFMDESAAFWLLREVRSKAVFPFRSLFVSTSTSRHKKRIRALSFACPFAPCSRYILAARHAVPSEPAAPLRCDVLAGFSGSEGETFRLVRFSWAARVSVFPSYLLSISLFSLYGSRLLYIVVHFYLSVCFTCTPVCSAG